MGKLINNKLNAVIADIKGGNYEIQILLAKTDGCAASETGPDKNDWIKDCEEQAVVYEEIQ